LSRDLRRASGYPAEHRVPSRNAPGMNQPGRNPWFHNKIPASQLRRWVIYMKNPVEAIESRMNYRQSNQAVVDDVSLPRGDDA
jgi:hypothetical protein